MMYLDKIPKEKSVSPKPASLGIKQRFPFQDNRISQMKQNREICQMQAWVGTRTLGLSGSSGSGSAGMSGSGVPGNTTVPLGGHREKGLQVFNPGGSYHTWGVHAHLLFDRVHGFPGGMRSNNIGYGGHGLFNEDYSYKTIGHVMPDEARAHLAVLGVGRAPNAFNITGGAYNLTGHNCQMYAMEVYNMYNNIQAPLAILLNNAINLHDAYLAGVPLAVHRTKLINSKNALRAICKPPTALHCGYSSYVARLRNAVLAGALPGRLNVANALLQVMNAI